MRGEVSRRPSRLTASSNVKALVHTDAPRIATRQKRSIIIRQPGRVRAARGRGVVVLRVTYLFALPHSPSTLPMLPPLRLLLSSQSDVSFSVCSSYVHSRRRTADGVCDEKRSERACVAFG